jgi:hypothetical protein
VPVHASSIPLLPLALCASRLPVIAISEFFQLAPGNGKAEIARENREDPICIALMIGPHGIARTTMFGSE